MSTTDSTDPVRLTVERLGHLGDGIAPGPVFVPRTLPGEVVEGVVDGDRMAAPRIMTPSTDRIRPACPHYNLCGGCSLQNASDAFVAGWKGEVVKTALAAYGLEPAFRPIITSPSKSRRRASLSGRRTKKGASVGFHGLKSGVISDISECRLLHPDLISALPAVRELVIAGGSRKSELSIMISQSDAGVDVRVSGGKEPDQPLISKLAGLVEKYALARLVWGDELIAMRHPPAQRLGRANVVPPPGAFLQATREGEAALQQAVVEALTGCRRVVDLFAGVGTFTFPLAESGEVHAIEGEGEMLDALDAGWRFATGLKKVTTETRDLFRRPLLPDELDAYNGLVIDPPRAGAEAQIAEICKSKIPVVAMVSCNPVTFARDANALVQSGFTIEWVQVVDQFRWSPHVETAALFRR